MDDIWPDRRILNSTCIAMSTLGKLALDAVDAARALKERRAAVATQENPGTPCTAPQAH